LCFCTLDVATRAIDRLLPPAGLLRRQIAHPKAAQSEVYEGSRSSVQNKVQNVACFPEGKRDHQSTTFTTHRTTNRPQKHHTLPPRFLKTPCKNSYFTTTKKKS
jgi:hypothetical protein